MTIPLPSSVKVTSLPGAIAAQHDCAAAPQRRCFCAIRDSSYLGCGVVAQRIHKCSYAYMRKDLLTYGDALSIYRKAEALVAGAEHDVGAGDVLRLAQDSGCSAYDCEFVALAEHLDVRLISADDRLCKAFSSRAIPLSEA